MRASELEAKLKDLRERHGDLPVLEYTHDGYALDATVVHGIDDAGKPCFLVQLEP